MLPIQSPYSLAWQHGSIPIMAVQLDHLCGVQLPRGIGTGQATAARGDGHTVSILHQLTGGTSASCERQVRFTALKRRESVEGRFTVKEERGQEESWKNEEKEWEGKGEGQCAHYEDVTHYLVQN